MKAGTYNIRVQCPDDFGKKHFLIRKSGIKKIIRNHGVDILSVQEVAHWAQLAILACTLPEYDIFSQGRDTDNGFFGERLAILYKPDKFKLMDKGVIKLTPMSEALKKQWVDYHKRICIWVKLLDLQTCQYVYVFNSHFAAEPTMHDTAVVEIIEFMKSLKDFETAKIVFMGDLNMHFTNNEKAYDYLTKYFDDANIKSEIIVNGEIGTGVDFSSTPTALYRRIDYMFSRNMKQNLCVTDTTLYNGIFPSDHLPIIAKID